MSMSWEELNNICGKTYTTNRILTEQTEDLGLAQQTEDL